MQLENGVAFITGGASGIGLALAQIFAGERMRIVLADIDSAQLVLAARGLPGEVLTVTMNVADREHWAAAKKRVMETFGRVDVLCNNAGIGPDGQQLADMNPESFERIIAINLTGVFNGIATFADHMRQRGSGHILNTASMAGLNPIPTIGGYVAAKFGVVGLSEVLCQELAPSGVGVTVLCPGLVNTRLAETTQAITQGAPLPSAANLSLSLGAISADQVARVALQAIREKRLYALTNPEYRDAVEARCRRLLESFDPLA